MHVYHRTPQLILVEDQGVLIGIFASLRDPSVWTHVRAAIKDAARRFPKRLTSLSVYRELSAAPGTSSIGYSQREEAEKLLLESREHLQASASVVLFTGFVAAALRGAIAGMQLLSRGKPQLKVFSTNTDALRWLLPLSVAGPSAGAQHQFETLCARLLEEQDRLAQPAA